MNSLMRIIAATLLALIVVTPAVAGGGVSGPPVGDPGDPGGDPGDGGGTGGGTGTGGTGTGGSGTGGTPSAPAAGAIVFTLDSLPTGASGTQAFYQPSQDYTALGLGTLPSAQDGLNQTISGLTLSVRTAPYVYDPANPTAPQTRISIENASSNFGYLGVPVANQVTVQAITLSPAAPGPLYADFSDFISSFSVETIRLFGAFQYGVTLTAYTGLDGSGTVLGSTSGNVGNLATTNYQSQFLTLGGINGARSVALTGTSGNVRYDNISVDLGTAPAAAVPEAATWMLMLAGFGAVGVAARRGRRVVAA